MVFVFRPGRHYAAALLCAEFRNSAVQHINLIKEIHSYGEGKEKRCWLRREMQIKVVFNCLLFTATHSLRSSPSGKATALRKFPEPSVAAACFIRSYWWVPSGIFFLGLKVLLEREPLWGKEWELYWYATTTNHTHTIVVEQRVALFVSEVATCKGNLLTYQTIPLTTYTHFRGCVRVHVHIFLTYNKNSIAIQ